MSKISYNRSYSSLFFPGEADDFFQLWPYHVRRGTVR